MTLLHLLADGALAAAQMLALLFVPPATAAPSALEQRAALEHPVGLHRLSTTVDVRLLGSLADVRVAQRLRNAGTATVDLGARLPAVDEHVDTLRVVRGERAVDLLGAVDGGCGTDAGHVRLSSDEAIADALQLPPGAEAVVEVVSAQPLQGRADVYRVALPVALDADAPRASLVEGDGRWFLMVVPHRRAAAATVVLRPTSGDARWISIGALDPRHAVLIPLRGHIEMEDVAEGAVEIELADGPTSHWSTVVAERADSRTSAHAGVAD